jgi:quercetin dioxygenase-like cupin family protein
MVQSKGRTDNSSSSKTPPDQPPEGERTESSMSYGSRPICQHTECIGQTEAATEAADTASYEASAKGQPPAALKKINLFEANDFSDKGFTRLLVHDSPYFKILNFNFKAGQVLPIHSHDIEGEVCLTIVAGEGEFLGRDGAALPAKTGDVLVSAISEPHGLRAKTALRLLVAIAPPI